MNGFMLTAAGTPIFTILYMAVIVGFFYFFLIRPQRKEQKEKQAMLNALAIGDSVLTTAGFYGVVIDMTEDTVIVEFGNNKNCRIPMQPRTLLSLNSATTRTAAFRCRRQRSFRSRSLRMPSKQRMTNNRY